MNEFGSLQRDDNDYPVMGGTSNVDDLTIINSAFDPVTRRLLVDVSGGSTNFVDNELVSGSGTSFTLADTPVAGSEHIFAARQRLYPTTDYSISGANITTVLSWSSGDLLADYRT